MDTLEILSTEAYVDKLITSETLIFRTDLSHSSTLYNEKGNLEREGEREREREREGEGGRGERKKYLSVDKRCQCHCVRVLQLDVVSEGVDDLIVRVDLIIVEKRQELTLTKAGGKEDEILTLLNKIDDSVYTTSRIRKLKGKLNYH